MFLVTKIKSNATQSAGHPSAAGKRSITQSEFDGLLHNLLKSKGLERVDFRQLLLENGYDTTLDHIQFNIVGLTVKIYDNGSGIGTVPYHPTDLLSNIDFSGITFRDCDFTYTNLKGCTFKDCTFVNCHFVYSALKCLTCINCSFDHCNFESSTLNGSHFSNTNFIQCQLVGSTFHKANLENCTFQECNLRYASFLLSSVCHSQIIAGVIEDCMFFGTHQQFGIATPPIITKPIIGFIWNSETPGYTGTKHYLHLQRQNCLILKIDCCEDEDMSGLEKEVTTQLSHSIAASDSKAQQLFENIEGQDTAIAHIYSYARQIIENLDGLVLSGGNDIYPVFYGEVCDDHLTPEKSYFRDVLEFSLINHAMKRGLPIQGICRGAQIVNIYFGGTNQTLTTKQKGVDDLTPEVDAVYGENLSDSFSAFFNHHQASDQIASRIDVIVRRNGFPYLMAAHQGSPILLTQFHPEFSTDTYSSSEMITEPRLTNLSAINRCIAGLIVKMAETYKRKKVVFEAFCKPLFSTLESLF